MFRKIVFYAVILLFLTGLLPAAHAWGFWGHARINYLAVFTLPQGMIDFYKQNIAYLKDHATDPDMRRYVVEDEAARHYIDLDLYEQDSVPKYWKDACLKYTEDTLKARGILPWSIQSSYYGLVEAMKNKEYDKILKCSADLGHYVADAHVPLHTTSNYDGQKTGQKGAHAFWESRLPELYGDNYDFFVGQADYIDDPLAFAWKIVHESHSLVDSVLHAEEFASQRLNEDEKYVFEEKGGRMQRQYSQQFSLLYHRQLNGMVERRMQAAILAVGSLWYSAWVDAGQPVLGEGIDLNTVQQDSLGVNIHTERVRPEQ